MRGLLAAAMLFMAWAAPALAQTDRCADPGGFCRKAMTTECMRLGASSAVATMEGACAAQRDDYFNCVARAVEECAPGAESATNTPGCDSATALALWSSAEKDNDCLGYRAFLEACPGSPQARFVASRLQRLNCAAAPTAPGIAPRAAAGAAPAAAPREPAPPASAGGTFKDCGVCPEMVTIPGGSFQMGSNDGDSDEKPAHSVSVSSFAIGRTEVTFAQWDACVADGGCGGYRPGDEGWGRGDRPVINVILGRCAELCSLDQRQGRRLVLSAAFGGGVGIRGAGGIIGQVLFRRQREPARRARLVRRKLRREDASGRGQDGE